MFFRILIFMMIGFTLNAYANPACQEWEEEYHYSPESKADMMNYAHCLIFNGGKEKALAFIQDLDNQGYIPGAFYMAKYIQHQWNYGTRDYEQLNETIVAYLRVISLIEGTFDYPRFNGQNFDTVLLWHEQTDQMELNSHYQVPMTYFDKFGSGAEGIYNLYLMQSPNYNGERNLNTYPTYNLYTEDSLEKTIEHANRCLSLPMKDYFIEELYRFYQSACQVLKDSAQALLPLEGERLSLLNKRSCRDALPDCQEYNDLLEEEIIPIIKKAYDELDVIFNDLNHFVEEKDARDAEISRKFQEELDAVTSDEEHLELLRKYDLID